MTLLGKMFNAIHDDESAEISSIDEKLSPSINDLLLIEDSEDDNNKKSIQIGNLPTGGGEYSGFGEVFVNLFSGTNTTDENNWLSIGGAEIDTDKFGFDGYFEAVLSSSDDAGAAELRLFNLTTNAQIGDILEVNGEVSFVSEQITLTGGVNIYEAQLRSPDGYYAVCKNARVSFYKFILNAPDASEDGYVAIAQSGDLTYIGGVEDGYVLTWNAGSWEAAEPTGGTGSQTLEQTLALGNNTGNNDIIIDVSSVIMGGGTIVASTPGSVGTPGALTLGIAAGGGFDDGSLTLNGQGGFVQIHAGDGAGVGVGGSVDIAAGSSGGIDADGGDVFFSSGIGSGTGRSGHIQNYVMPSEGSGDGGEFQVYIGYGNPEDLAFKVGADGDGYFSNNLVIGGKLTVGGLIDPTGLVLDEQATVPGGVPDVGKATIWVRSSDGYAVLTNSDGETTSLSGGGSFATPTLLEVLTEGNSAGSLNIVDLSDPVNPQDAVTKSYVDGYVVLGGDLSGSLPDPTVTDLTIASEEQGSVLYYNGSNWVQLSPGEDGYVLTTHSTAANPTWEEAAGTGADTDAVHINVDGEIATIDEKTIPDSGDLLIIEDSIDGNAKKRLTVSNLLSSVSSGAIGLTSDSFISTDSQTEFTLSSAPAGNNAIMVIDGYTLSSSDYSIAGITATYSGPALSAGQSVEFWYGGGLTFPTANEDGYVAIAQSGDLIYIDGVEDGYVLTWNTGLSSWEAAVPTGSGAGIESWISPDPITDDTNDWNPTGFSTATIVRVDAVDDGYSITGFDASATAVKKEVINVSSYDVVIANQDVGSATTNRIISQTGGLLLAANDAITIIYDHVTERWRVI